MNRGDCVAAKTEFVDAATAAAAVAERKERRLRFIDWAFTEVDGKTVLLKELLKRKEAVFLRSVEHSVRLAKDVARHRAGQTAVSYTHLTLPTILLV